MPGSFTDAKFDDGPIKRYQRLNCCYFYLVQSVEQSRQDAVKKAQHIITRI